MEITISQKASNKILEQIGETPSNYARITFKGHG